jgi:hypothetical protein
MQRRPRIDVHPAHAENLYEIELIDECSRRAKLKGYVEITVE